MKRIALLICLLSCVASFAQEHEHGAKGKNATFEKLKTLLGDWESKQGPMAFHVSYKLVSGGTAIMETAGDQYVHAGRREADDGALLWRW